MSHHDRGKNIDKLVAEGDRHAAKGRFDKALTAYLKARAMDPQRTDLDEKIIAAHEQSIGSEAWSRRDFVEHIDHVMRKQEHDYPPIKQVHARLGPEWRDASALAFKVIDEADDDAAAPLIEELVSRGEIATRVLIDILRMMKHATDEEPPINGLEDDT